jgi:hypothetical protein
VAEGGGRECSDRVGPEVGARERACLLKTNHKEPQGDGHLKPESLPPKYKGLRTRAYLVTPPKRREFRFPYSFVPLLPATELVGGFCNLGLFN